MRIEEFQKMRNEKAVLLQGIKDKQQRRKEASELATQMESISASHGFITQTWYWVFHHAGLNQKED